MTASNEFVSGLRTFTGDVINGFIEITRNGAAMVGLLVVCSIVALTARADLRQEGEARLMGWLQSRQPMSAVAAAAPQSTPVVQVASAAERAIARDPKDLPRQQAVLAYWLSKKYRVAPEPLSTLVSAAFEVGKQSHIEPTLILAVMAVESGFNPFAQSPVGAQGLMQVMTSVHTDKYEDFGGNLAAFDPVTNLRVGVQVLKDCIARGGSVEAGLHQYVGATTADDGGYANKVMAEQNRLRMVALGKSVPVNSGQAPSIRLTSTPAPVRIVSPPDSGYSSNGDSNAPVNYATAS